MHFKRFIYIFFLTLTGLSAFVIATNYLVDPFKMFSSPTFEGVNKVKPEYHKHIRMSKAFTIRKKKPSAIILGSSRAEVAMDPKHPGWNTPLQEVYNLALSSGRIYELEHYLKHAHQQNHLRKVVLSVDLFMFNANIIHENGFSMDRLSSAQAPGFKTGWLNDIVISLFSLDALQASFNTVTQQHSTHIPIYLDNGERHPTHNWKIIQHKGGGHYAAFRSNIKHSIKGMDSWENFNLTNETIKNQLLPFNSFKRIVAFCRKNNIKLYIYISPIHALKQEVIWQLNLWDTYEQWKKQMVAAIFDNQHKNDQAIELWDFSGFHSIATEKVPTKGDKTSQMQWYWEGSHYKKRVGDMILNKMFYGHSQTESISPSFGVSLTPENILPHLNSIRKEHDRYILEHPDDVKYVRGIINEFE